MFRFAAARARSGGLSKGLDIWFRPTTCSTRSRTFADHATQCHASTSDAFGDMTEIEKIMANSIRATGPLSFSTYMQLCLSHPVHGYYMKPEHAVFGTRGDFTTSPEISQVFGELLAVWMIQEWLNAAGSKPFRIVELGPGRGTLMDDMLRVVCQLPAVREKLTSLHLVETSGSMRALQREKLHNAKEASGFELSWHDSIDDVPHREETYTMLVAHEFFDALPVHVLEKTAQGWHEVLISLSNDPSIKYAMPSSPTSGSGVLIPPSTSPKLQAVSSRWTRVLSPTPTASSALLGHTSPRFATLPVGSRIEVSGPSVKIARRIAELIRGVEGGSAGGCALVIDYGGEKVFGNSLRAFKEHKIVDIFHRPGECDITANVDFALLKEVLGDLGYTPRYALTRGFLNRLGVRLRAANLMQSARTEERKTAIADGVNRLVDPLGMGGQYAVLGVTGSPNGASKEAVWPFMEVADGAK
ncbi:S-adenosyl-L-methionine-dependent methyltransferase [Melanogaster broomeanus]|nr:S-adenosyl-L-methionine-dependent methyltransferase [Melanogaster broomeanus]